MHLYLNYAREHWTHPDENPPVGLILCTEHRAGVARYALEGLTNKILAAEYRMTLPSEESWPRSWRGPAKCWKNEAAESLENEGSAEVRGSACHETSMGPRRWCRGNRPNRGGRRTAVPNFNGAATMISRKTWVFRSTLTCSNGSEKETASGSSSGKSGSSSTWPQEIVGQILRRSTVERHPVVFKGQSRLAE